MEHINKSMEIITNKLKELKKKQNGESLPNNYECDICRDIGWILGKTESGETVVTDICQCRVDKNNKKRLENSGLLNTIEKAGFDKYTAYNDRTKKIKKMAMEFLKQKEKPFFYIGGEVGRGKTFICTAICKDYLENHKKVYYKICSELLRELKSNVNDDVEYYRIFNKYSLVEVLYIDDLFKSRNKRPPTDADVTHMFELINNRYINNRITLFSSELSINDVMYIDEGLGSRIYEKSKGFNFSTDGLRNFRLED